ncbi:hypothetical protein BLNAU_19547 [Blattamonas nauphoetae]|uniref:Uncharacterized protein n=1 Tax=Blattamonas nauphoetae TaxID=2049346 RepID=A0ABQ9X1R8_9EUKA|nr:hypothetical protein BLNAU_19547 [Blattamonas nauphoetae]
MNHISLSLQHCPHYQIFVFPDLPFFVLFYALKSFLPIKTDSHQTGCLIVLLNTPIRSTISSFFCFLPPTSSSQQFWSAFSSLAVCLSPRLGKREAWSGVSVCRLILFCVASGSLQLIQSVSPVQHTSFISSSLLPSHISNCPSQKPARHVSLISPQIIAFSSFLSL